MSEFCFYFNSGIRHILHFNGFAYLLFVCLLCARYRLWETRQLLLTLILFTIGHSCSLLISSFTTQLLISEIIKPLLFATVLVTALSNVLLPFSYRRSNINYVFITLFGLIHGISFSTFFKQLSNTYPSGNTFTDVVAFNLGLELGQLIIIGGFTLIYLTYLVFTNRSHTFWCISSSIVITLLFSVLMIV